MTTPDLNSAYRQFNLVKYWAVHKGATFQKLFPDDVDAYNAYVKGDVRAIMACTKKLTAEYGKPAFKANSGDRDKARLKYYAKQATTKVTRKKVSGK